MWITTFLNSSTSTRSSNACCMLRRIVKEGFTPFNSALMASSALRQPAGRPTSTHRYYCHTNEPSWDTNSLPKRQIMTALSLTRRHGPADIMIISRQQRNERRQSAYNLIDQTDIFVCILILIVVGTSHGVAHGRGKATRRSCGLASPQRSQPRHVTGQPRAAKPRII